MREVTIAKFGGTSVGSLSMILKCANIVQNNTSITCVVVSAQSQITDFLADLCATDFSIERLHILDKIHRRMKKLLEPMYGLTIEKECQHMLDSCMDDLTKMSNTQNHMPEHIHHLILAMGEKISSQLVSSIFRACGIENQIINARDLIKVNDLGCTGIEPDTESIKRHCLELFAQQPLGSVVITQGFTAEDATSGNVITMGRGGSDLSAALLAEALSAKELQLWTDVEGIFTVDPREIKEAKPLSEITFDIAAKMARFGAKVVHPETIAPVMRSNIPVLIGATNNPKGNCTWIKTTVSNNNIGPVSITRRKSQTLITARVHTKAEKIDPEILFSRLAKSKLHSDWTAYTDNTLSILVDTPTVQDNDELLDNISENLASIAEVHIEENFHLISIVGNGFLSDENLKNSILSYLSAYPIRCLMLGSSDHLINWLIPERYSKTILSEIHQLIFKEQLELDMVI